MIQPIPTHYAGCFFRSRLEARWAVFFDSLGIGWEYEVEGFDLGDLGRYLPDFYLPGLEIWAEIKPAPDALAEKKLIALTEGTGVPSTLLSGGPWLNIDTWHDPEWGIYFSEGCDCGYRFCTCGDCGKVGYCFDGRGDRVCGRIYNRHPHTGEKGWGDKGYSYNDPKIIKAANLARSERFGC